MSATVVRLVQAEVDSGVHENTDLLLENLLLPYAPRVVTRTKLN